MDLPSSRSRPISFSNFRTTAVAYACDTLYVLRMNFLYRCILGDIRKMTFSAGSVRVEIELLWYECMKSR
jgi:hypothetical protein